MPHAAAPTVTACAVLPLDGAWLPRIQALRARPGFWWLDSALPGPRLGRSSFAGAEPYAWLRAWAGRTRLDVLRAVRPDLAPGRHVRFADPLEALRAALPPPPADEPRLPFLGGAVGALGYELARPDGPRTLPPADGDELPELCFALVDRLLQWDHLDGRGRAIGLGFGRDAASAGAAARRAAAELAALSPVAAPLPFADQRLDAGAVPRGVVSGFDEAAHAKAVARVKHHIGEGDLYQACLTHRLEVPFRGEAFHAYAALRRISPAPFAAFLELPDVTVAGSSPERFLQVTPEGWAESRPIKGTRPRGTDPEADRAQQRALAASPKDRAENLMIVDLVRNDLGRVCEIGSVHVPELMAVEPYATVFQLVSTVRGRLRPGADVFDALRATFPPGSMTGAPKLAAVERLARLEPVRRGLYAGALGYLDVRGACELAVVIRTLFLRPGRAWLHTGGGIVADSDAGAEWREAGDKARALLAALAASSGP